MSDPLSIDQVVKFDEFINELKKLFDKYNLPLDTDTINLDLLNELISLSCSEQFESFLYEEYNSRKHLKTAIRNYYNEQYGYFNRYLCEINSYFEFKPHVDKFIYGKGRLYGNKFKVFTTYCSDEPSKKLSVLSKLTNDAMQFIIIFLEGNLNKTLTIEELSIVLPKCFKCFCTLHDENDELAVIREKPLLMPLPDNIYRWESPLESIRSRYISHQSVILESEKILSEMERNFDSDL